MTTSSLSPGQASKAAAAATARSHARWTVLAVLFFITVINYADRATISLAGPSITKDLGLSPVAMGYVFSAFGWAYVAAQLPGGWLLDKFGSKRVYAWSIGLWSFFTLTQGSVGFLTGMTAIVTLFALRFVVGAAEAPSFPANSRIVAAWFPSNERGTASAIFNSAQYAAQVFFGPLMGWVVHTFGWHHVFTLMGVLGLAFVLVWNRFVHEPKKHPRANAEEIAYIEAGGALTNMDNTASAEASQPKLGYIKQLLGNRMMLGIYIGQYCINALTYFFITWFPVYLVQQRGMSILKAGLVASIPAICGFLGGILGGFFSDWLLKRGHSLTVARKVPIVLGMGLSMVMIGCNYTDSHVLVITLMAMSFFGKGLGSLGWAVNSDTAPKKIAGLSGGLLNTCGNLSSITTPIAIGYILDATKSFNGALVYVGLHALGAALCYLVVVQKIERVEVRD